MKNLLEVTALTAILGSFVMPASVQAQSSWRKIGSNTYVRETQRPGHWRQVGYNTWAWENTYDRYPVYTWINGVRYIRIPFVSNGVQRYRWVRR